MVDELLMVLFKVGVIIIGLGGFFDEYVVVIL